MAKILMVIAPEGYQDVEYGDSKAVLEAYGHEVTTASTVEEAHGKLGGTAQVDVLLENVNHRDYDAVAFIGGPGCYQYFDNHTALSIAQSFFENHKLTTAICAAPSILANAGLIEGKTVTCFESQAENLKEKGGRYTGQPVERDGLIITANGPNAAKAYGEEIHKTLAESV